MATVAEQLRQARLARNLTVEQVAEILKIRTDHVRALEEGTYEVFSAPVYVRGFVRTYGTLLKLDVPQLISTLEKEVGPNKQLSDPPPLPHHSRSPVDFFMLQLSQLDWRKAAVILGALVVIASIILGVTLLRKNRGKDPLSGLKPGVYQSTQGVSGETLPLPAPPKRR